MSNLIKCSVRAACGRGLVAQSFSSALCMTTFAHNGAGMGDWNSRVVSVLYSGAVRPGFKSQPRRCRVTVLGKPFTPIVPLLTKQRNWSQPS